MCPPRGRRSTSTATACGPRKFRGAASGVCASATLRPSNPNNPSERRTPVRSGFATLVGRPNVGKSTLLNRILRTKVTIVSDKPQTTRTQVRGVLTRPDAQVVFVDTPGIHKPRTLLGERLNDTATGAIGDVDVVCLVVDATAPIGRGDQWVAQRVPSDAIVVVNKTDIAPPNAVLEQLAAAASELAHG